MGYFETVYRSADLSHKAKAVYIYLCDRANAQGQCWPGIRRIGTDLNLSRSTVKRALRELTEQRYITKELRYRDNGGKTSNLYTVLHMARGSPHI